MQTKYPTQRTRRVINRERDLLDQKWLTHLLTCILVLLGGIFVLAATRREWIIDQAKWIVKFAKLGLGLE
jgi:SpoVK/Ycf46/Vps4 family AAA+-type ATPase